MSKISSWIISVVCAVLLGVLVEVVLPEGKLNKLLKSVVGVLVMLVIVSPLKNLNLTNLNFQNLFDGIKIDQNFVDERGKESIEMVQSEIETVLTKNGFEGVVIKIDGSSSADSIKINTVFADLTNLVLKDNSLNINKYTNIAEIIKSVVDVESQDVIFYE